MRRVRTWVEEAWEEEGGRREGREREETERVRYRDWKELNFVPIPLNLNTDPCSKRQNYNQSPGGFHFF